MNAELVKLLSAVVVVAALAGWGLYERTEIVRLNGELELAQELKRETNRAVTALGNATTRANALAVALAQRRQKEQASARSQIEHLETLIGEKTSGKDCRDALKEWRNGQ